MKAERLMGNWRKLSLVEGFSSRVKSFVQWVSAPCWTAREMPGAQGDAPGDRRWKDSQLQTYPQKPEAQGLELTTGCDFPLWRKARLAIPATDYSMAAVFRMGGPSSFSPLFSLPNTGELAGLTWPSWNDVTQHEAKARAVTSSPDGGDSFLPSGVNTCRKLPDCTTAGLGFLGQQCPADFSLL